MRYHQAFADLPEVLISLFRTSLDKMQFATHVSILLLLLAGQSAAYPTPSSQDVAQGRHGTSGSLWDTLLKNDGVPGVLQRRRGEQAPQAGNNGQVQKPRGSTMVSPPLEPPISGDPPFTHDKSVFGGENAKRVAVVRKPLLGNLRGGIGEALGRIGERLPKIRMPVADVLIA